jgi:threonine synthase
MTTATHENPILAGWRLTCVRCGADFAPGLFPRGCPVCLGNGRPSALVADYQDLPAEPPPSGRSADGIWKAGGFLPRLGAAFRRTLGEGDTPLVRIPALCEQVGCDRLYLKLEAANPTGAHKDRFHAVSVAVGAALGVPGVVSFSTGNHGLSMSAYAALHGLPAVVVCHARMPLLHQRAIRAVGGLPIMLPTADEGRLFRLLVEEAGWYPSSTTWPLPDATPYGVEGYKTIAYELFHDLGGQLPDVIFCPSAAGDGLVGLWRGAADLRRIGAVAALPRLVACQPAGAAPLVAALAAGLDHVPTLEEADSRALSIGDPVSGDLSIDAVRATDGSALAVGDDQIVAAQLLLSRYGVLAELSSAASLAGAMRALKEQPALREATMVCILTSSGLKWIEDAGEAPVATRFQRADAAVEAVLRQA